MAETYLDSSYASLDLIGSGVKSESFEDLLLSLNITQERLFVLKKDISTPLSRMKVDNGKEEGVTSAAFTADEDDVPLMVPTAGTSVGGFIGGPCDLQVRKTEYCLIDIATGLFDNSRFITSSSKKHRNLVFIQFASRETLFQWQIALLR